ncbi:MAG: ATP-binding protein [Bacteroidia bacterium]|nr:ATP-binding protein [Bacteroidia bacterium]
MKQEEALITNARALSIEYAWFHELLKARFKAYFEENDAPFSVWDVPPPDLSQDTSVYGQILKRFGLGVEERVIILLALAPHVCPQLLDMFFSRNENYARGFTEFGGMSGAKHSGFLPTGETLAFLMAGTDLSARFRLIRFFEPEQPLVRHGIVTLEVENANEPILSGMLKFSREYLSYVTTGRDYRPDFSSDFPAKLITTNLTWDDLVLDDGTLEEVEEIHHWLIHHDTLMLDWGLARKLKPGYKSLFYGPPGTGKTLTASLLGKSTGLDVYRVDLSKIVSKYIGETEKNLAYIFDQAENKRWILFFDEADAIFGKRSQTSDAKDRYANQEISYLLQRIEDFPGVVILSSNLKANIDEAFIRRFQSIIHFPMPRPEQRKMLWMAAFSPKCELAQDIDWDEIARDYETSGGAINNIMLHCSLRAITRGDLLVKRTDILDAIKREFKKEGKTL